MAKEDINPEVHHDDIITPYAGLSIPENHIDRDEEVCSKWPSDFQPTSLTSPRLRPTLPEQHHLLTKPPARSCSGQLTNEF